MKKLIYVYEKSINLISIIVVEVLIGFGLIANLTQAVTKSDAESWITSFIIILILGYGISSIHKVIARRKKDKTLIEEGTKVKGTIDSIITNRMRDTEKSPILGYFLKIKIKHPQSKREVEFITPELDFNPYQKLASKECSVYVLENEAYATDFVPAKTIEDALWKEEEPKGRKMIRWLPPLVLMVFIILVFLFMILCFK